LTSVTFFGNIEEWLWSWTLEILGTSKINAFMKAVPDSKVSMSRWLLVTKATNWSNPMEVKSTFNSVDITSSGFVFNVGGNSYRILAKLSFTEKLVTVIKVGTHAEYSRWTL
jgi:mRNA interferase HigB